MQVSIENVGSLERRLTVSLPAQELDQAVSDRLRDLSRSVQIKGFRRGKVPPKVIEQRFGRQVRGEALSALIGSSFNQAVSERNLRPAGTPNIETSGEPAGGELRFVATFEVVPEFGRIEVKDLEIARIRSAVEDADIDAMIQTLRTQRRTWRPVERAALPGDLVMIESHSTIEGVRRPEQGSERGATVIGSGAMLAEIEQALAGMRVEEAKQVALTYPAQWRAAELAGKPAQIEIKVVRISEPVLPDLDTAFIASFGIGDGDLERFRAEVRSNLERELKGVLLNRLREEVADKLIARFEGVELPRSMIEAEAAELARRAEEQARRQGLKDVSVKAESLQGAARRRVAAGLILSEIARQQQVRLDPQRLEGALATIASTYEEPQQVIDLYRSDANLMNGLRARVLEEQVIDWVAEHARCDERHEPFAEIMRAVRGGSA